MISIIGAGPVGNYLASLLAKHQEVKVFEEHKKIGRPIQCTGILTGAIDNVVKLPKELIKNRIKKAVIVAPNQKYITVKMNHGNLIIDRDEFDQYIGDIARENGAKFIYNHRLEDVKEGKEIELSFANGKKYKTDILVGADGPGSVVAKKTGIYGKRENVIGAQARVKGEFEEDTMEIYLVEKGFGWSVPENDKTARVGIAQPEKPDIYKLLKEKNVKVLEWQSGLIPVYNPKVKTQKDNVYLVGDAATMVKASTYGGIVQGMMAAEELTKSILEGKNYRKRWKRRIGKDLLLHLIIRNRLDKFNDNKFNELVNMFRKERLRNVIETHDRDFPTRFLLKLLIREPRLIKFGF